MRKEIRRWLSSLSGFYFVWACVFLHSFALLAEATSRLTEYTLQGRRYVSLKEVATHYGLTYSASLGGKVEVFSKSQTYVFHVDQREALFSGIRVWLHYPVLSYRGRGMISEADFRKTLQPLLEPAQFLAKRKATVVVLDPGHGGPDVGAVGRRRVEEKRAVLDIAKRVRVHLANAGMKVYLTRETDRFIPLEERTAKAARWGAQIFVSIHLNASPNRAASGVETYILAAPGCPPTAATVTRSSFPAFGGNVFDESNMILGYHLQRALVKRLGAEDRGLRRARFVVLRNAPCTAALIECGFVSNPHEEGALLQSSHRESIALAIVQGILNFAKEVQAARLQTR